MMVENSIDITRKERNMDDQEKLGPQPAQEIIDGSVNIDEEQLERVTGGAGSEIFQKILTCIGCNQEPKFKEGTGPNPAFGEHLIRHPETGKPVTPDEIMQGTNLTHKELDSKIRVAQDMRSGKTLAIRVPGSPSNSPRY
jgi:hypothetical protein